MLANLVPVERSIAFGNTRKKPLAFVHGPGVSGWLQLVRMLPGFISDSQSQSTDFNFQAFERDDPLDGRADSFFQHCSVRVIWLRGLGSIALPGCREFLPGDTSRSLEHKRH